METKIQETPGALERMFLDIPTAAALAGFSVRHFRRIIEDKKIPTIRIRRKSFILGADFHHWKAQSGRSH